jgi:gamma-glutamyltranspeptidase
MFKGGGSLSINDLASFRAHVRQPLETPYRGGTVYATPAVTQTLLSAFGSRFVLPQSGVLMNDGIVWFDPTPGGAN